MTNEQIVRWVIDNFEGHAYTDDPIDTGGATRHGITLRTLQWYRRIMTGNPNLIVTKKDVEKLTIEEAVRCGVKLFLEEPHIDDILDSKVKLITFDYYFHSGGRSIKDLQRLLLVDSDGKIGPITLNMINLTKNQLLLAVQLLTLREDFMQRIMTNNTSQRKYMFGWWIRTTRIQKVISGLE